MKTRKGVLKSAGSFVMHMGLLGKKGTHKLYTSAPGLSLLVAVYLGFLAALAAWLLVTNLPDQAYHQNCF